MIGWFNSRRRRRRLLLFILNKETNLHIEYNLFKGKKHKRLIKD